MPSLLERAYTSVFRVTDKKDLRRWDHCPSTSRPVYGVYHVFCDAGWEAMVKEQTDRLKASGLLDVTKKLYVSCIARTSEEARQVVEVIGADKAELIAVTADPQQFEFPALDYIYALSQREDALVYYFHTKGITYQNLQWDDKTFMGFREKIMSWRRMMEYFLFDRWTVAVNVLEEGYQTYGCYLFPPFVNKMYAGNFWWARTDYFRQLDALDAHTKATDRFMAEEWLLTKATRPFSAFDTVADLYTVNILPAIYESGRTPAWAWLRFFVTYTWRKYEKKWLGRSYKKRCQARYQHLKQQF
jgi:hypothetical protein